MFENLLCQNETQLEGIFLISFDSLDFGYQNLIAMQQSILSVGLTYYIGIL